MQIHLRDCFWCVLLIGGAFAWWVDHRAMQSEVERPDAGRIRTEKMFDELFLVHKDMKQFLNELGYYTQVKNGNLVVIKDNEIVLQTVDVRVSSSSSSHP